MSERDDGAPVRNIIVSEELRRLATVVCATRARLSTDPESRVMWADTAKRLRILADELANHGA